MKRNNNSEKEQKYQIGGRGNDNEWRGRISECQFFCTGQLLIDKSVCKNCVNHVTWTITSSQI